MFRIVCDYRTTIVLVSPTLAHVITQFLGSKKKLSVDLDYIYTAKNRERRKRHLKSIRYRDHVMHTSLLKFVCCETVLVFLSHVTEARE